MNIIEPMLFVEINESNFILIAGKFDEHQNFKIIEKIITPSEGLYKAKFVSIDDASREIKKNVEIIENKIDHIFKNVTVVIDNFNYSCVNISGFKKLNGSQVQKENISYILNSLKQAIMNNEQKKTILHIFNSKNVLDNSEVENLPIGLFGDFYNHELTFFLLDNNNLKNIKFIFNKINLNVSKVFLKSFSEGTQLVNKTNLESFFIIKIYKNTSKIIFFDKSSFKFSEYFSFGTDLIIKDITKICSLDTEVVTDFLSKNYLKNKINSDDEFLEKEYFIKGSFRKIRKKLILDIADSRIEEIISIIFNKNINIRPFKKNNSNIFFIIQDKIISDNFEENFKSNLTKDEKFECKLLDDFDPELSTINTAKLSVYGWKKEAIPIIQTKNSLITRIFKAIFD